MHVSNRSTRAVALIVLFSLCGCANVVSTKHSYAAEASSPEVKINGAAVRLQLKPEGTRNGAFALSAMVYSAAVVQLDGPFRWRIEATGEFGKQERLILHRLRTRTSKTKRDEWYPKDQLGKRADFVRKKGSTGSVRAVYDIPGLLVVKPDEDGALEILADLTVVSSGRSVRKTVSFRLEPSQKKEKEFIFFPSEIVKGIGQSPEDWGESDWD